MQHDPAIGNGDVGLSASRVLGRKLDSIPFSGYQVLIIVVLALVGFIEGYDLVMTGSLLVLAKEPLHLTGPTSVARRRTDLHACLGGFAASAISDHCSRKTMMLIGVIATTFFTLLIPLVQNSEQLIIVRLLTALAPAAVSAAFPIAAELMPAQHRRTYGAIYEMRWRSPLPCCRSSASCSPATRTPFGSWRCRAGWQ